MLLRKFQSRTAMNNWWPVSNEEWERLNYPERFRNEKILKSILEAIEAIKKHRSDNTLKGR